MLHDGDLTDGSLITIILQVQPYEVYKVGLQSYVSLSCEAPEFTANSDALGTLRALAVVSHQVRQRSSSASRC